MTKKREAIIGVIGHICSQNNSLYCQISQACIMDLMNRIYGEKISRRGLNYAMKRLEHELMIRRKATRTLIPGGEWKQNRTIYFMTRKGIDLIRWLSTKFRKCATWLRVKCPAHISLIKKTEISLNVPASQKNPPEGVVFWQNESSLRGFLAARAAIESL
jgi:hypothetical protein